MTYYVELRRTVERTGPLQYVPLSELDIATGFRSVYAVDSALRDLILRKGSVGGLEHTPVYSDMLFIDFDTELGVEDARAFLNGLHCNYSIWDTGRRGAHFHIPIEPMLGASVPHSHLEFVRANFVGDWDATVYRHHSIIRLPGTYHEKNPGHRKELRALRGGGQGSLRIPMLMKEAPPPVTTNAEGGEKNPSEFWSSVLSPHVSPGRTFRIFHLGALAAECGIEYDEAFTAARSWAQTVAQPPLDNENEIRRVFSNGYKKGGM